MSVGPVRGVGLVVAVLVGCAAAAEVVAAAWTSRARPWRPELLLIIAWYLCYLASYLTPAVPLSTISAALGVAAAVFTARMIRKQNLVQKIEPSHLGES
ncbi:hypothetical protein ABZ345_28265 [Lentzea sp. NPDC005914]|uniref:hypothetical protein n=1 Tax=Lentzea sp. NPDC005914 TaxID=3154572 RepID=UPI0033EF6F37